MIEKEIRKVFNELQHNFDDLKAEVLVAEIMEHSMLEYSDVNIHNDSTFTRSYSRDVIKHKKSYNDAKEHGLDMHLSRNGLYDKLPQSIFHDFHSTKQKKLTHKESRQLRKKEEKDARLFFRPLENEFFYQKLSIEQKERELINKFNVLKDNFLTNFWSIDEKLSDSHLLKLLKLLPYANQISGNIKLVGLLLEKVINEKVTIIRKDKSYTEKKEPQKNDAVLGVGFTLDSQESVILYPQLEVRIKSIPDSRIYNFVNGSPTMKFLNVFYDYFLPMEFEVKTILEYNTPSKAFALNKTKSPILGLNTSL